MDAYLYDRPRPRSKAPAQAGPDLFTTVGSIEGGDAEPTLSQGVVRGASVRQPSDLDSQQSPAFDQAEGVRRKEAALREFNEKRGELLGRLRQVLRRQAITGPVTADDAVEILAALLRCSIEDAPTGAWMGALFRSSEWEFSHWTVSERTTNNGRSLRAWRLK